MKQAAVTSGRWTVALSVSSNGSEWVKRRDAADDLQQRRAFSILKRIGVGETYSSRTLQISSLAFSILKRIGVGETYRNGWSIDHIVAFQYPQTDRSG